MATFNNAHHESGGVVLFSGELILLFCDNVHLTLPQTSQDDTGRLFLTTHRLIFTSKSMRGSLKSFSAPFYSMHDLNLEQPIFGANYIKGKVNDAQTNNAVTFKLKFNSGGAIEYGQALQNAARLTRSQAGQNSYQPPPYTATASQYYQAPPTVYQPAYNCGFVLPTDIFNQAPPAGFIYTSEAPPPYPGLGAQSAPQYAPQGAAAYPPPGAPAAPAPAYGGAMPGAMPGAMSGYPPTGAMPGYPPAGAPPAYPAAVPAYSAAPSGPGFSSSVTGYPPAQQSNPPAPGYYPPTSQPGYPPTSQPGYPPSSQPGYPPASNAAYPPPAGAPGYPPLNNDVFSHASAPSETPEKRSW